jgi:hypothetical protein
MHHGSANSQINKGQRNYARGKVNHVTAEQAQDAPGVVLGTFSVNSVPATVLFRSITFIHYQTICGKTWNTYKLYEDTFVG